MSGIYIHIPFCKQACTYCDFHFSTSTKDFDSMINAIKQEIVLRKNYGKDAQLSVSQIDTIYFGGGTPSLLKSDSISEILQTIRDNFEINKEAEITLEANPDDLSLEKCESLIASGVNRLSIGIQSFDDEDLRFMNRAHNSNQSASSVKNAKQAGFRNISIDLIYGLQNQGILQWKKNLEEGIDLDVDHISSYALTIEPKTALADMIRKKKVSDVDEEKMQVDFELLMDLTAQAGYEHYEISNFARNKKYSKHNTSYWKGITYLGVGPSAHSYDGSSRQWNVSNNAQYIQSLKENKLPFEKEDLTEENKYNEFLLTSLRTMWGLDLNVVREKFGAELQSKLENQLLIPIEAGMMSRNENIYILTRKGKFFADGITASLFR